MLHDGHSKNGHHVTFILFAVAWYKPHSLHPTRQQNPILQKFSVNSLTQVLNALLMFNGSTL